ncbi:hypothetical protein MVEN_00871100 [Mycena venus]|uniref:F-box domain-containing protein n=1 Tax=Mycena venus TaxID=2733690 RepID=A0A8H7D172_9AGAR|nr:hypothetical protein MVEN_00871100 [Mycena venus]
MRTWDFALLAEIHAPLLAETQINFTSEFDADIVPEILSSNLFRAMKTTRIILSDEDLNAFVPDTHFAWDHLTHLTLSNSSSVSWLGHTLSSQTVYQLLKGCKNLRLLHCFVTPLEDQAPWVCESLVLPSLHSLPIDAGSPSSPANDLENLIDHLIMPRLRLFHAPNSRIEVHTPLEDQAPWVGDSLVLPSLHSLTIDTGSPLSPATYLANIIDRLIMPRLRLFHIPNSRIEVSQSNRGFLEHLAEHRPIIPRKALSACHLRSFTLLAKLSLWNHPELGEEP